ncbi:hypothetical protein QWZ13_14875 [Reinekea marina]|nr:hypothetical protein [Reinekea marina]MDN3650200.1 hypothetical protein [Reinekea marina]
MFRKPLKKQACLVQSFVCCFRLHCACSTQVTSLFEPSCKGGIFET